MVEYYMYFEDSACIFADGLNMECVCGLCERTKEGREI